MYSYQNLPLPDPFITLTYPSLSPSFPPPPPLFLDDVVLLLYCSVDVTEPTGWNDLLDQTWRGNEITHIHIHALPYPLHTRSHNTLL